MTTVRRLTEAGARNAKPKGRTYEVRSANGFCLRVTPAGAKTWVYSYRSPTTGKQTRLRLGSFPGMTFAQAHEAHATAFGQKSRGIDPSELLWHEEGTLAELVDEYLERYARVRKKTWEEDERVLKREVLPHLGKRRAGDIRRRDVKKVLEKIVQRGAGVQANRTLGILRKVFNWAIEAELGSLEYNPCWQISRPTQERARDRVLTPAELTTVLTETWNAPTDAMCPAVRLAILLQFATGQRPGEVAALPWREIDFRERVWTIDRDRSKNGIAHRIPLSDFAIDILRQSKVTSDYVFQSPAARTANTPIGRTAVRQTVVRLRKTEEWEKVAHFSPHDIRRTVATFLTTSGVSRFVVSRILNHAEKGITRVYDRYAYDAEKRAALDDWGIYLEKLLSTAEVAQESS